MREVDPLIKDYMHLPGKPRSDDALQMLRKVASIVKPIMRKRSWRVGVLAEFYPTGAEESLWGLNINRGSKIFLRLRLARSESVFMRLEDVVDTMLHELAHIIFGPHDGQFHGLWNELRNEHQDLVQRGYTGEGFLSEGKRLGGRNVSVNEARRRARRAAETRQVLAAKSGQKLGGGPSTSSQQPKNLRHLIAEAAQKRATITNGCASVPGKQTKKTDAIVEQATRNGFRTQAEEDNANDEAILQAYIELLADEEQELQPTPVSHDTSRENGTSSPSIRSVNSADVIDLTKSTTESEGGNKVEEGQSILANSTATKDSIPEQTSNSWSCPVCTLENPEDFLCCGACTSERPSKLLKDTGSNKKTAGRDKIRPLETNTTSSSSSDFWICHFCGNSMESQWWTCAACGTMKLTS